MQKLIAFFWPEKIWAKLIAGLLRPKFEHCANVLHGQFK
jgi:hypothetical protein